MSDLLIGAIVGFVPTLIIFTLNSMIQGQRDRKSREWQIADRREDLARKTVIARIEQLEEFSRTLAMAISQMSNRIKFEIASRDPESALQHVSQKQEEFTGLQDQFVYYYGIARYLGNDVFEVFVELTDRYSQIFKMSFDLWIRSIEAKALDMDGWVNDPPEQLEIREISALICRFLIILDTLRNQSTSQFAGITSSQGKDA